VQYHQPAEIAGDIDRLDLSSNQDPHVLHEQNRDRKMSLWNASHKRHPGELMRPIHCGIAPPCAAM